MANTNVSPMKALMAQTAKSPLVRLMGSKGLIQADVADCLEVSRHTVSNWVNGKTVARLSLKDWDKLAELLGTTIDKLPRNFAGDK